MKLLAALLCVGALSAEAPVAGFRVVRTYPHDRSAFTQGLEYHDGYLYEGTGLNGRSWLRKVELTTGRVVRQVALPYEHFGEGITLWGDQILQLTEAPGLISQFPDDAQGPAPAQQVKQRHDRAAGRRAAHPLHHIFHSITTISIAKRIA